MFFTVYVLDSLRLCKPKTEGQAVQKENLMEKLKTEIKILIYLGLA